MFLVTWYNYFQAKCSVLNYAKNSSLSEKTTIFLEIFRSILMWLSVLQEKLMVDIGRICSLLLGDQQSIFLYFSRLFSFSPYIVTFCMFMSCEPYNFVFASRMRVHSYLCRFMQFHICCQPFNLKIVTSLFFCWISGCLRNASNADGTALLHAIYL